MPIEPPKSSSIRKKNLPIDNTIILLIWQVKSTYCESHLLHSITSKIHSSIRSPFSTCSSQKKTYLKNERNSRASLDIKSVPYMTKDRERNRHAPVYPQTSHKSINGVINKLSDEIQLSRITVGIIGHFPLSSSVI